MVKAIQIQHDETFDAALRFAKNAGFQYVALGFGSSRVFHEDGWEKEIGRINSLLEEKGLMCIQTHLPYYDLKIDSSIIDPAFEKAIKRCIRATSILGAKYAVLHLRSAFDRDFSTTLAREDNRRSINDYIPVAKDSGVVIALENLPIFPWDTSWRFYSHDYEELISFADSFKSDNVKICWDFGHAHLTGIDQRRALSLIGDKLVCTHIHDNFENNDHHLIPGIGTVKWEEIMPTLNDIGYQGPLTLELEYKNIPDIKSYINHSYFALEYLEKLVGGVGE